MPNRDAREVERIIYRYFQGLHHGDVTLLDEIFHNDCVLKAPHLRRDKHAWLELVKTRQIPAKKGDIFAYQILNIELSGDQAMVKVLCPLLGSTFIDYLGLLFENNQWLIVNKMYADMPSEQSITTRETDYEKNQN